MSDDRKQRRKGRRVAKAREVERAQEASGVNGRKQRQARRATADEKQRALQLMRGFQVQPELQAFFDVAPEIGAQSLEAMNRRLWAVQAEVAMQHAAYKGALRRTLAGQEDAGDEAGQLLTLEALVDLDLRTAGTVKRLTEAQTTINKTWLALELDKVLDDIRIEVDAWRTDMAAFATQSAAGSDAVH